MTAKENYLAAVAANKPRRKPGGLVKPVGEKHRQVARDVLRKGKTICEALVAAGYALGQAKTGMRVVRRSHALRTAFQEETEKIEKELAAAPLVPNSWNAREQLILARLEKNIRAGKDGGALSCKLLGSHKALALWEVDSRTGIIIVNGPNIVAHPPTVPEDDPE